MQLCHHESWKQECGSSHARMWFFSWKNVVLLMEECGSSHARMWFFSCKNVVLLMEECGSSHGIVTIHRGLRLAHTHSNCFMVPSWKLCWERHEGSHGNLLLELLLCIVDLNCWKLFRGPQIIHPNKLTVTVTVTVTGPWPWPWSIRLDTHISDTYKPSCNHNRNRATSIQNYRLRLRLRLHLLHMQHSGTVKILYQ